MKKIVFLSLLLICVPFLLANTKLMLIGDSITKGVQSANGLGFRDGGYVILLGKIGVSKAAALSLSFLAILIPMLISIAGGILFMLQKKGEKEKEVEIAEKGIS